MLQRTVRSHTAMRSAHRALHIISEAHRWAPVTPWSLQHLLPPNIQYVQHCFSEWNSLVNMAQISVQSLWHYIWGIKTDGQTLWFHKDTQAHKWNEMNIMNNCMRGKKKLKKKINLAYCIRRSSNVMVGRLSMRVCVTLSHVRRGWTAGNAQ